MSNPNEWDAETKIKKARIELIWEPFFGSLLHLMPMVEVTEKTKPDSKAIDTMATNGKVIYWNREYVNKCTFKQVMFTIVHELMHPALGHIWRFSKQNIPNLDHRLANIACDLAGNEWLVKCQKCQNPEVSNQWELPDGALLPEVRTEKDPVTGKMVTIDLSMYKGCNAEAIYKDLLKRQDMKGESFVAIAGMTGDMQQDGEQGQGKGDGEDEGEGTGGLSKEELEELSQRWEEAIQQAEFNVKKQGFGSGGIEEALNELQRKDVSALAILRNLANEDAKEDYSWGRPNSRYSGQFLMPSLHSKTIGTVVLAVDSSGSMCSRSLQVCLDWIHTICLEYSPKEIYIVDCDTQINQVTQMSSDELWKLDNYKVKGRGGTLFEPVFEWVEKENIDPVALVYMTDMGASFPEKEPPYPVVWADTYGCAGSPPWGYHVSVPLDEN